MLSYHIYMRYKERGVTKRVVLGHLYRYSARFRKPKRSKIIAPDELRIQRDCEDKQRRSRTSFPRAGKLRPEDRVEK